MKTWKIFLGFGVFLFFFCIYKLSTFTLFDHNFEVVESIKIPNKNYILKIYHIPPNATSQSYIQIRRIENGVEDVLENYERFNHLDYYAIEKDTLILQISDSDRGKAVVELKKLRLP